MNRSSMDGPSSEKPILPWFWIIEYLTSYPQVPMSVLYGLINEAPPLPDDLKGKVDEFVALACLEELCRVGNEPSATTVALSEVDLSKTCQDVLECILQEASVSDIMTRAKPLQWHIKPFILHKRASMSKTSLQKLKDAILDGSCQIESSLKKMSGVVVPTEDFRVPAAAGESEFLLPNAKKRKIARNPDSENLAENLHEGQQNCDDFDHLTDTQLKQFRHDALEQEEPGTVNESGNPETVEKVVFSVEDDGVHKSRDQMGIPTGDNANPQKNSENGSDHGNPVLENAANDHLSAESPEHILDTGTFKEKEPSSHSDVNQEEETDITLKKSGFLRSQDLPMDDSLAETGIPTGDYANPQKDSENGSDHRNPVLKNAANGHLSAEPSVHNLDTGVFKEKEPSDVNQHEEIYITLKNSDFLRSLYPPMDDDSLDDCTKRDVCAKCGKDDDQVLVCRMESCILAVHERCLGFSAAFDETGNFCCPLCSYSAAVKEYRESKKKASLLKKDMAAFTIEF